LSIVNCQLSVGSHPLCSAMTLRLCEVVLRSASITLHEVHRFYALFRSLVGDFVRLRGETRNQSKAGIRGLLPSVRIRLIPSQLAYSASDSRRTRDKTNTKRPLSIPMVFLLIDSKFLLQPQLRVYFCCIALIVYLIRQDHHQSKD